MTKKNTYKVHMRRLVIVVISLGALGFIANLVVDNPYMHRLVRLAINERMQENTRLRVDFSALKVKAVPPGIDLYSFRLSSIDLPQEPLLAATHVRARVSLWSLLLGELGLSELNISGLQLNLPFAEQVGALFPDTPELTAQPIDRTITWPPEVTLPIDTLTLQNASIYWESSQPADNEAKKDIDFALMLSGLDARIENNGWNDLRGQLTASSFSMVLDKVAIFEHAELNFTTRLINQELTRGFYTLHAPDLNLEGSLGGKVVNSPDGVTIEALELSSSASFQGQLSLLGKALEIDNTHGEIEGDLIFESSISFTSEAETSHSPFYINAAVKLSQGVIDDFKLHNSTARLRVDKSNITFEHIDVIIDERTAGTASGYIGLSKEIPFDFYFHPEQLSLTELLDSLQVDFDVLDFDLKDSIANIRGRGAPFYLTATGDIPVDYFRLNEDMGKTFDQNHSPHCILSLNLLADARRLRFDGSKGACSPSKAALADDTFYLEFRGRADFETAAGMDLHISSEAFDFASTSYFQPVPVNGSGVIHTRIHGPYDGIRIDTTIAGAKLSSGAITVNEAGGKITYFNDSLIIENLRLRPDSASMLEMPRGTLNLNKELTFDANIIGSSISRDTISKLISTFATENEPASFELDMLYANLAGSLLKPLRQQGEIRVVLQDGTWQENEIFERLNVEVSSDEDGIQIKDLSLTVADLVLTLTANHKFSKRSESDGTASTVIHTLEELGLHRNDFLEVQVTTGAASAQNVSQSHLQRLPIVGNYLETAMINGRFAVNAELKGQVSRLQGVVQSEINHLSIFASPIAPVRFRGFVDGSKVDLLVNHSGNSLTGRLSFDLLAPGTPYEMYLYANRFDVRPLGTRFFFADPRNYAYLNASLNLNGTFENWWASTGSLDIDDIRIWYVRDASGASRSLRIQREKPVRMTIKGNRWEFADDDGLVLLGEQLRWQIYTRDNILPGSLGLFTSGEFDVALSTYISPEIESASGRILVNGELAGSIARPTYKLEARDAKPDPFSPRPWEPVSLGIAELRPPLENVDFYLTVDNERVALQHFRADKGTGTVNAQGLLGLSDAALETSRIDINLAGASLVFPAPIFKSMDAGFTGNLAVTGTQRPLMLSGDLQIDRGRSTGDFDLRREIIAALRRRTYTTQTVFGDPWLELNLRINADQTISVNNRNLQAILSTNLVITGTQKAPAVAGQIEVDDGKFMYKRDFRITQGNLTFDDPTQLDPKLDIMAVSEISSYRVFVNISGRASEPIVDLSIEPPTRDDATPISKLDIITLMSTGQLPDNNRNLTDSRNVAQTEALTLFGGFFEEPVEKLFDLAGPSVVRQVYIDAYATEDGTPVARLNMPLNLGNNWEMIFRVDQDNWKVSSEYSLHDNISILGSFDGQTEDDSSGTTRAPADTGVDLRFRFSFP